MIAVLDQLMEGAGVVRVSVFLRTGRRHFECQWRDPLTRKKLTESTRTAHRGDAYRYAVELEQRLNSPVQRLTWPQFRERYRNEVLSATSPGTRKKFDATFNAIELHAKPAQLTDLTASRLSEFTASLRALKLEESTIRGHLDTLRISLKWAKELGFLDAVPRVKLPAKGGMRGRPVTLEEFDRMVANTRRAVGPDARRYRRLIDGLWWSGLRLSESLHLHWTRDTRICVDAATFETAEPMFRIAEETDKGRVERLFPIPPEFVEWLRKVPAEKRRGYVFKFGQRRPTLNWVSKRITKIGRLARVKVKDKHGKLKWASAHDLRRSFGFRWSVRVMPPVLMALMRHESIETTMVYYVGQNAAAAAKQAWAAFTSLQRREVRA